MQIARANNRETEVWREGVETMRYASGGQLVVFEQSCAPGMGAPLHVHDVEEVLRVISGTAEVRVGRDVATLTAGDAVSIPAGDEHSFVNIGTQALTMLAVLAGPDFEAHYIASDQTVRRWMPEN